MIEIPRTKIDTAEIPIIVIKAPEVEQANFETADFTVCAEINQCE